MNSFKISQFPPLFLGRGVWGGGGGGEGEPILFNLLCVKLEKMKLLPCSQ